MRWQSTQVNHIMFLTFLLTIIRLLLMSSKVRSSTSLQRRNEKKNRIEKEDFRLISRWSWAAWCLRIAGVVRFFFEISCVIRNGVCITSSGWTFHGLCTSNIGVTQLKEQTMSIDSHSFLQGSFTQKVNCCNSSLVNSISLYKTW